MLPPDPNDQSDPRNNPGCLELIVWILICSAVGAIIASVVRGFAP